jgi:3-oxoacyl-[acyl-carrier-protein] synthase-3
VGRRAAEVDLLVNASIYKDGNTAEPALASLVQQDIGANPGHPQAHGRHGTFSFDVSNGAAGALTAAHLVDGFVSPGTAHLGLVVTGDADPAPRTSRGFPFLPAAGAILLRHTDDDEGFERFSFRTFPRFGDLFEADIEWAPDRRRNVVRVSEDAGFADACIDCAMRTVTELLDGARIHPADIDLLVTSQYPGGVPEGVARACGVPVDRVPAVPPALRRAHTAGVIASLEAAIESGAFARAKTVLFVAVGAGITVGAALYGRRISHL